MHFVFNTVEEQGKQQLKGNLNSPEFKCKIHTLASPSFVKRNVSASDMSFIQGPCLPL